MSPSITYRSFFGLSFALLLAGLWIFGISYLNEISVIALVIVFGFFSIIYLSTDREASVISPHADKKSGVFNLVFRPFLTLETLDFKNVVITNSIILLGLVVFGVLNLLYITSLINASSQTISIINGVSIFSLIITQIGGCFFQSCMIYMFAFILKAEQPFNTYLSLVASAYIGFFIVSIITIPINFYFIPSGIAPEDFKALMEGSFLHGALGKAGEYWTLTLISFGIYSYESSFTILKSLLVSLAPSVGLLLVKLIFSAFI